jgi:hypothetical protein
MTSPRPLLLSASGAALLALATWNTALACACCANPGQRSVRTVPLDADKRDEISQLRFARTAQLYTGEAEPEDVKGIATPSAQYDLNVAWENDRLVFALRDRRARVGTLSLARLRTISQFEVDPRNDAGSGLGPVLYKEWTLTSPAAGSGVFSAGLGPGQELSLILHGRGNSCTSIDQFKHWTLVMRGPKANYKLFGDLQQ